jgi:hypothetical protein
MSGNCREINRRATVERRRSFVGTGRTIHLGLQMEELDGSWIAAKHRLPLLPLLQPSTTFHRVILRLATSGCKRLRMA